MRSKLKIKKESRSLYKYKSIYSMNLEYKTDRLEKIIFINPIVNHSTKSSKDKSCQIKSLRRLFFVKRITRNHQSIPDNSKIIVLFAECWIVNANSNTATNTRKFFLLMSSMLLTNGLITVNLYKKTINILKNNNKFKLRILKMMMINFKC